MLNDIPQKEANINLLSYLAWTGAPAVRGAAGAGAALRALIYSFNFPFWLIREAVAPLSFYARAYFPDVYRRRIAPPVPPPTSFRIIPFGDNLDFRIPKGSNRRPDSPIGTLAEIHTKMSLKYGSTRLIVIKERGERRQKIFLSTALGHDSAVFLCKGLLSAFVTAPRACGAITRPAAPPPPRRDRAFLPTPLPTARSGQ
ncbi:hypothetical protein EVAR_48070_1 [Eumeta japonica]|uniref:Uncharacterized protein n=1 Tax=Eumeta variegata TaxID=151549 RepID=A0A4C1X9R4_EUMVA|nr:hypothetical protein EVAR_48070_1 [Eumeta japonica]